MKCNLTLEKTIEVDTDDFLDGGDFLRDALKAVGAPVNTKDLAELHDAMRWMLNEDMEAAVDLDIRANDFQITVLDPNSKDLKADETSTEGETT